MYWHIDTDVVSVIVICAIYIYYRRLPAELRSKCFLRCLQMGIIVTLIDIAASLVMEIPVPRFVYHLLMTLYFVSIELVIVEWLLYVLTIIYTVGDRGEKCIRYTALTVYAIYALFVCLNPWTGAIYSLGPNNEYMRGPFFSIMIILFIIYTIALFSLIVIRRKHIPNGFPGGLLLATPAIIALGIVTQLAIPGLLLMLPSYMICLVLSFLFLQNMQLKSSSRLVEDLSRVAETDVLTGLYNRSGMEAMVKKTLDQEYGQNVLVVIADIDDLKMINDTLGHAAGDEAIRLVASQLKQHFRACDTVVRYGGDEFLAFLTGCFTEEQLAPSISSLVSELSGLRIGPQNDVRLHCSVGAAFGVVGHDSFESLCIKADAALYFVKRSGKNSYAFYSPDMKAAL